MKQKHATPHACEDCVNVHGDTAGEWLTKWPQGAEYRRDQRTYLCDGCAEDRDTQDDVAVFEMFDY